MLSPEKIQYWYDRHIWSAQMVQMAVAKNVLTQQQADSILGRCPV